MTERRRIARWVTLFVMVAACGNGCGSRGPASHAGVDGGVDVRSDAWPDAAQGHGKDASTDEPSDAPTDVAQPKDLGSGDATDGPIDESRDVRGDVEVAEDGAACQPVTDAHVFVDPMDGRDDLLHTGSAACPLRTLTAALALIGVPKLAPDAAVPTSTITILNTKGVPRLSAMTGERFTMMIPAGVTIDAEDPTRNTPILALTSDVNVAVMLEGRDWRLSHLDIQCNGGGFVALQNLGGDGALDHVTIEGCRGHGFLSERGTVTAGPGLDVHGNEWGIKVEGGTLVVLGGRGTEHTSISGNTAAGVWLHGGGDSTAGASSVDVQGGDIAADQPDDNDVAIDDNDVAILFDATPTAATVRGLHATGNRVGIEVGGPTKLRGSYLANNLQSAIVVTGPDATPPVLDFGQPGAQDPGRNVFSVANQAGTVNTQGAICATGFTAAGPLRAAGNIFGATDCLTGGALTTAPACNRQVDVAGGDPHAIDVSGCTTP